MSGKLYCGDTSCYLLLVVALTRYFTFCGGTLMESVEIPIEGNTTRPEVTIPQGTLRGMNMVTRYNRTVFGFVGVPYAKPPVGDLRFRAPVPPDMWNGTLDASSETEPCLQPTRKGGVIGNEDCLYHNVFTPRLPTSENSTLLPVIVYIIGGAFKSASNKLALFSPYLLLDKDVVLVVPNYRLGVLGFLSTGDEVSPGNYGLKDIVRVLKWIQESIKYFGGDPNQVTMFGGSSGAMSIHLLALSDSTEGLIHRYITQSGSALAHIVNRPKEACAKRAIQLGEHFGCPTNTSRLLVNCLRGFNASQLMDTDSVFFVWRTWPITVWTPTSEPDIEGALLVDTPANLFAAGKVRDLPWIASVVRDEGMNVGSFELYEHPDVFEELLDNIDVALPLALDYADVVDDVDAYTAALKSYYLNDLTADRSLLLNNLTELFGDSTFVYPEYNALKEQLVRGKSPQYFCSFEYLGTFRNSYFFSGGSMGYTVVAHGDEFIYFFEPLDSQYAPPGYQRSDSDWSMVDTMIQLWTSFASNGTPAMVDSVNATVWEPYSALNNYLRIGIGPDVASEMKRDLFIERMQFWDKLTETMAVSGESRNSMAVLSIVLWLHSLSYIL